MLRSRLPVIANFFTADPHSGDHRTINLWRRRFPDTATMDAHLIARWNATFTPAYTVWLLGDKPRPTFPAC